MILRHKLINFSSEREVLQLPGRNPIFTVLNLCICAVERTDENLIVLYVVRSHLSRTEIIEPHLISKVYHGQEMLDYVVTRTQTRDILETIHGIYQRSKSCNVFPSTSNKIITYKYKLCITHKHHPPQPVADLPIQEVTLQSKESKSLEVVTRQILVWWAVSHELIKPFP